MHKAACWQLWRAQGMFVFFSFFFARFASARLDLFHVCDVCKVRNEYSWSLAGTRCLYHLHCLFRRRPNVALRVWGVDWASMRNAVFMRTAANAWTDLSGFVRPGEKNSLIMCSWLLMEGWVKSPGCRSILAACAGKWRRAPADLLVFTRAFIIL